MVDQTSVVEHFAAALQRDPDAVAVDGVDGRLSFADVDRRAERVRHELEALGVTPGDPVFHVGTRGPHFAAALLATWRLGAVWRPLEPDAAPARHARVVGRDRGAVALVMGGPDEDRARDLGLRPLRVDLADPAAQGTAGTRSPGATDAAYVTLTSGTTGEPKGVVSSHQGLARLATRLATHLRLVPDDGVLQLHPSSVDISLEEVVTTWRAGCRSVPVPDDVRTDLVGLDRHLRDHRVTVVDLPTSLWIVWLEAIERGEVPRPPTHLRVVGVGSEPVPRDAIARWLQTCGPGPALYSLYGSTETGITTHAAGPLTLQDDTEEGTPLGHPLPGVVGYVLDESLTPVAAGGRGQLYVRADVAALGYRQAPAATAAAFVPDPFAVEPGGRMYATGDCVSETATGALVHHGRIDATLSVNGFSVRPEGVARVLGQVHGIESARVHTVREGGVTTLVADLQPSPPGDDDWRPVYEALYADDRTSYPLGLDATSWLSAVDGSPVPLATMEAWRDAAVARVLDLEPRRVLELGCGTGMVLHGIVDHVERYVGIDFVPDVVETLETQVRERGVRASVELHVGDIRSSLPIRDETFDVVVLNSVVQYLRGGRELRAVLDRAAAALAPGGHVVVGDVRNLDLDPAYRDWLAAQPGFSPQGARSGAEIELQLAPRWFHDLAVLDDRPVRVATRSKDVDTVDEMSLFRYDAVLELDADPRATRPVRELAAADLTVHDLQQHVQPGAPIVARALPRGAGVATLRSQAQALGLSCEAAPHPLSPDHLDVVLFTEQDRAEAEEALATVARSYAAPRTVNQPQVDDDSTLVHRAAEQARDALAPHERPSVYRVVRDGTPVVVPVSLRTESATAETGAGSTPLEREVAAVWSEVLGQLPGPDDNFFDLGGNSLNLARVLVRLRSQYSTDLAAEQFFAAPTVRGTAALLGDVRPSTGGPEDAPSVTTGGRDAPVAQGLSVGPASFAQERLWLLDRLAPGSRAYHSPFVFDVDGEVDVDVLEQAVRAVEQTHPALRTALRMVDGTLQQQVVESAAAENPTTVTRVDATVADDRSGLSVGEQAFVDVPFDLSSGALLRVGVLPRASGGTRILFVLHHVAVDELSLGRLFDDVASAYTAIARGTTPRLPTPTVSYLDAAIHERSSGPARTAGRTFWRDLLAGAPTALDLPVDRTTAVQRSGRGARRPVPLGSDALRRAEASARREGLTTYQWWFALFSLFLARECGADDLVVGAPSANRPPGTEDVVGFFVNTLPVRCHRPTNPTVSDHLRSTARELLAAQQHEDVPLQEVLRDLGVGRSADTNPLFQTMVVLEPAEPLTMRLDTLEAVAFDLPESTSTMDLTLVVRPTPGDPRIHLVHDLDVVSEEEAERMATTFALLVDAVLSDPERRCLDPVDLPDDLASVLGGGDGDVPSRTVAEAFLDGARDHPEATAVVSGGRSVTYGALRDLVADVVGRLREAGAVPPLVPVVLPSSPELVAAMLAVNTAGSAFVPLAPDWPAARLERALENIGSPVVVGDEEVLSALDGSRTVVTVPRHARPTPPSGLAASFVGALDEPMYAMFTSGTTGEPKAVKIAHRGVLNRLAWMSQELGTRAARRVLWTTAPQYDSMVWESLWPLTLGGATVVGDPTLQARPEAFCRSVAEHQVSTIDLVPGVLRGLLEHAAHDPAAASMLRALEVVVVGGEELTPGVAALLPRLDLGARFLNLYGPTEATIGSVAHELHPSEHGDVPIGRPITNTSAAVLDEHLQPVPRGVRGELVLGGACVGLGYHRDAVRTRARYLDHPSLGRVYRTGDLARVRRDGSLAFLGRDDDQLSINGVRVETAEIVRALEDLDGVADAGVTSVSLQNDVLRRLGTHLAARSTDPELHDLLDSILDQLETDT